MMASISMRPIVAACATAVTLIALDARCEPSQTAADPKPPTVTTAPPSTPGSEREKGTNGHGAIDPDDTGGVVIWR